MSSKRPAKRPSTARPDPEAELTRILTFAVKTGPSAVVVTDAGGVIRFVNRKFCKLSGYTAAQAVGQKASLLKSGLMPAAVFRRLWARLRSGKDWTGEFHNRRKDGSLYWEQASITPIRDDGGHIRYYLKIAEDITARKHLEEELRASRDRYRDACKRLTAATRALKISRDALRRLSQEDALTGLLNRRGLETELARVRSLAERHGCGVGVLIIDIDRFKLLNDHYGHAAGDRILQSLAALLRARLRAADLVCRYGGDELVVVLPAATEASTRRAAERILSAVRKHDFSDSRTPLAVTVSIGAACGFPAAGLSLESIIKRADRALYRVKRGGRNGRAFAAPCDDRAPDPDPEPAPHPGGPLARALLAMLEARDPATAAHCRRVAQFARLLACGMGLPSDEAVRLAQGGLLHDIGKVGVADAILRKPGPLTEDEQTAVRRHARVGEKILRACSGLEAAAEAALVHHERLDGSGYPRGLKGARVTLSARILAVADTYDTIRSNRPYAAARSAREALREIRRHSGSLFDPDVVRALARCQPQLERVLNRRADT